MKTFNQPLGGNEMARFGGPATMMRLPAATSPDGLDVAFIGIPMDHGTSNRSGTRLGPRQIRDESRMLRPYNMATGAAIIRNTVLKHWLDTLGLSATLELGGLRSTEYLRSMETIQPVDAQEKPPHNASHQKAEKKM